MQKKMFLLIYLLVLAGGAHAAEVLPEITVYKSPTCGCCGKWADHLRSKGFKVKTFDTRNMGEVKAFYGLPRGMQSCHTATVGGYVIEGHVPAGDIKRLLKEKPAGVVTLAVPGMPMGSPGMEGPHKDHYKVMALDQDGMPSVWSEH